MKILYILLYSILFINSSLFASYTKVINSTVYQSDNSSKRCSPYRTTINSPGDIVQDYYFNEINSTACPQNDNGGVLESCLQEDHFVATASNGYCQSTGNMVTVYHMSHELVAIYSDAPIPTIDSNETYGDNVNYYYSDGSYQMCSISSQDCLTFDDSGNVIPNLPINGQTFNAPTAYSVARVLEVGGLVISALSAGSVIVASGGLLSPLGVSLGVHSGFALAGLGLSLENNPYTLAAAGMGDNSSSTTQGIKIDLSQVDLSTEDTSVAHSVSSAGEPESTVTNPDGSQDIVTETPTDIKVKQLETSGASVEYTIPKEVLTTPMTTNDFSEANNPPEVTITKVETPAPIINDDGTQIQNSPTVSTSPYGFGVNQVWHSSTTTPSASISGSSTSSPTTSTSTSTSTTSQIDSNTTSTTSSSTTDFSSITSRLNQLISQGTKQNKTLTDIKSGISDLNSSMKDSIKQGTKEALAERDQNITDTTEDNTSDGNGWSTAKNALIGDYGKSYTVFSTTCGSPTFEADITYMGTTIQDPLKTFDQAISPYFTTIKAFMILTATLLGLLSIFRR